MEEEENVTVEHIQVHDPEADVLWDVEFTIGHLPIPQVRFTALSGEPDETNFGFSIWSLDADPTTGKTLVELFIGGRVGPTVVDTVTKYLRAKAE